MKSRGKAHPVEVLHLLEGILDMGLGSTAKDDFLRGPVVIIGTKDAFPETATFEISVGL